MGPKPIQDVVPPKPTTDTTEPPSGPEIVGDIPVRATAEQASDEQNPQPLKDDNSSFIVPAIPAPIDAKKDRQKPKTKDTKPKPALAIVIALLAVICLAAGAYLEFFSSS